LGRNLKFYFLIKGINLKFFSLTFTRKELVRGLLKLKNLPSEERQIINLEPLDISLFFENIKPESEIL